MGLLDGVSGALSDAVVQNLTPDMVGALSGLLAQPADGQGAPINEISNALTHVAEVLQVDVDPTPIVGHVLDAAADSAPLALPPTVDPADFADRLGNLHDALQGIAADAAGRAQSPDSDVRSSAQAELQQAQQIMDVLQSTISQIHDGDVQVVDTLHSNANTVHDDGGTVVALSDTADAHVSGHTDTDGGTSHVADHVDAAPAHEDVAASDPSSNAV